MSIKKYQSVYLKLQQNIRVYFFFESQNITMDKFIKVNKK